MTAEASERPRFTIALTGDVMLGRLVNELIDRRRFAHPWGGMLPLLRDADLLLINLECALTAVRLPARDGHDKAFHFRADPEVVESLRIAGVDFVSLANNHAGDFGAEGLVETVRVLDAAGIRHAGAGPDAEAARRPAVLAVGGWRVAVVAFADYPAEWAASDSPGINYVPVSTDPEYFQHVRAAIDDARASADFVVFCIHWGPNMRAAPTPAFQAFARAVIDAGADLFWGHSAHVVQGVELWHDKPVLYDTGDFVDDYAVDPELRNDLSALFLLRVRPPHVERLELVPVKIDDMQVNRAAGDDRAWFVERFARLSADMGTRVTAAGGRIAVAPGAAAGQRA